MSETESGGFKPPYMSFQTFWTYIGDLGSRPLPPTIDRSMMTGKSGTDQANLFGALKSFGLIGEDNKVWPTLVTLVEADEEARKPMLANILQTYYAAPLRVSAENGTEDQLHDSFRTAFDLDAADTRRKSITFFVHAAKEAGIALSPNFKQTRSSGPRGTATRKTTQRKPKGNGGTAKTPNPAADSASGETVTIDLGENGKVTVTVDVQWLKLDMPTFTALRSAIADLEALARGVTKTSPDRTPTQGDVEE